MVTPLPPRVRRGTRPVRRGRRALALGAALTLAATGSAGATTPPAVPTPGAPEVPVTSLLAPDAAVELSVLGRYSTGEFAQSAAEIVVHDPGTQRLFVVNALGGRLDVLDVSEPSSPALVTSVTFEPGEVPNSVDVRGDGLLAVAVEAPRKTDPGRLVLLDGRADQPQELASVQVGALPDMVTWTPDGSRALVANEGEPAAPGDEGFEDVPAAPGYAADPAGSVSVVTVVARGDGLDRLRVRSRTAGFERFDARADALVAEGLRLTGPTPGSMRLSTNVEPEYIAVAQDGRTAWVTLQEASALARLDVVRGRITDVQPLERADHSAPGHGIDPSDEDGAADVREVPVTGIRMPDALASYQAADGETYLVTANEGDARAWGEEDTWRTTGGWFEEARVKDLGEDGLPPLCADSPASGRTDDAELGRLTVTTTDGLAADGTCVQDLHAYGSRSFSIWSGDGELVFDSGSDLEEITAQALPELFNSDHEQPAADDRSDNKGPEPEGVAVGRVGDSVCAFVALERVGGIAVYDVTDPRDATFVQYVNPRDPGVDPAPEDGVPTNPQWQEAGDLGPEGVAFIPAQDSPVPGTAVLAVAHEISGSTTLLAIAPRG